jgi:hypothetical protein
MAELLHALLLRLDKLACTEGKQSTMYLFNVSNDINLHGQMPNERREHTAVSIRATAPMGYFPALNLSGDELIPFGPKWTVNVARTIED